MNILFKKHTLSLLVFCVSLGLLATGCPKPGDIRSTPSLADLFTAVNMARDEARAQWADTFAPDIYQGAEELLAKAQQEREAGSIEAAQESLIRARERFVLSAELAPMNREKYRKKASEEMEKVRCIYGEFEAAGSWTCSPRKLQTLQETLDEAQTAHDEEDYIRAMDKAEEARKLLDEALIESAETEEASE